MTIEQYIEQNLPLTIRENREDHDPLLGVPYPYLIPSASDMFQEMYYWDTYFANQGLLLRGDVQQVKWNIDDLRALLDRFGFVPNGNHKGFRCNSQPPVLALMIRELYDVTKDIDWLRDAYRSLEKEHEFWLKQRTFSFGLAHYDCQTLPEDWISNAADCLRSRMGHAPELPERVLARGMYAVGESGWDFTPRYQHRTYDFAAVDLNMLLYAQEDQLAYFAGELGLAQQQKQWLCLRERRAELCRSYLRDEAGVFYDYDAANACRSELFSAASFFALYVGLATPQEAEAARKMLPILETPHGITVCPASDVPGNYQWGYPNDWPPLNRIVTGGLLRYGFEEDARRLMQKFVNTVERSFEQTGHLWEKYNGVEGNVAVRDEYKMPAMLGWTFGIYTLYKTILKKQGSTL